MDCPIAKYMLNGKLYSMQCSVDLALICTKMLCRCTVHSFIPSNSYPLHRSLHMWWTCWRVMWEVIMIVW